MNKFITAIMSITIISTSLFANISNPSSSTQPKVKNINDFFSIKETKKNGIYKGYSKGLLLNIDIKTLKNKSLNEKEKKSFQKKVFKENCNSNDQFFTKQGGILNVYLTKKESILILNNNCQNKGKVIMKTLPKEKSGIYSGLIGNSLYMIAIDDNIQRIYEELRLHKNVDDGKKFEEFKNNIKTIFKSKLKNIKEKYCASKEMKDIISKGMSITNLFIVNDISFFNIISSCKNEK